VLNQRVRELRESGLLEAKGAAGYGLTPLGRELIDQVLPLVAWSARWAAALTRARGTPRSSR
jgi:DNA-binding HxlR family transcriptional regulator